MSETVDDAILIADSELNIAYRIVTGEISAYPTPISGCDAQFNALLEKRKQIAAARRALKAPIFVPTSRQPEPVA